MRRRWGSSLSALEDGYVHDVEYSHCSDEVWKPKDERADAGQREDIVTSPGIRSRRITVVASQPRVSLWQKLYSTCRQRALSSFGKNTDLRQANLDKTL